MAPTVSSSVVPSVLLTSSLIPAGLSLYDRPSTLLESRARVSAIRGVNVDGVVRTLVARGLVQEMERDPLTGALLYGTTPYFLEKLGLDSISELPQISPYLPGVEDVGDFDG